MAIDKILRARRFDPLTRVSARHPHEHATPADYAKSIEPHSPLDTIDMRGDLLYRIAVVVGIFSGFGVIGILLLELWIKP